MVIDVDGRIGPDPVTSPTSIWAFWTSAALRPSSVSRFSRWCTSAHIFWSHMKIAISTIASGICKGRASTNQRVRLQLHLTATCGHPEVKGKIQFLPPPKKKMEQFSFGRRIRLDVTADRRSWLCCFGVRVCVGILHQQPLCARIPCQLGLMCFPKRSQALIKS